LLRSERGLAEARPGPDEPRHAVHARER